MLGKNITVDDILIVFLIFPRKQALTFSGKQKRKLSSICRLLNLPSEWKRLMHASQNSLQTFETVIGFDYLFPFYKQLSRILVRLMIRRSRVRSPPGPAIFFRGD